MEGDKIQTIIEDLLKALTVSYRSVDKHDGKEHVMYHIATDDAPILIGTSGDHLRALNYIAKKIAEHKHDEKSAQFILDVNGYQRRRIEVIEREAHVLAERARTFKSSVEMQPLNSYERMIVHQLFTDDPDITTESAGEGSLRHVVLRCQGSFAKAETNDSLLID